MGKKNIETSLVLRNEIYQTNPLIQARKKFDLMGMRIFMLGLRGLNPHLSESDKYFDADFQEMFIPTSKLTELFGNTKYLAELKPACKKLFEAVVELDYEDGGFELYHLFRKLKYVKNEGLYIWFDDLLRPYILDLFQSRGYTKLNVKYLFELSSPYAVRLLELMLQYQNIAVFKQLQEIKRKFTVEEIRFVLNIPEGAYDDRIDNLRSRVLDVAIKEIVSRTPYIIRYQPIKEGRKVVAFDFTMDTYNVPRDESEKRFSFKNDAVELLKTLGFDEGDAWAIFRKCRDIPDCFSRTNRARALLERQKNPIKNRLGFLRKAIEEDWQIGRATGKRSTFANSERNAYSGEHSAADRSKKINVGRKKISYQLAETIALHIRQGDLPDIVTNALLEYRVTPEKFMLICRKHGI